MIEEREVCVMRYLMERGMDREIERGDYYLAVMGEISLIISLIILAREWVFVVQLAHKHEAMPLPHRRSTYPLGRGARPVFFVLGQVARDHESLAVGAKVRLLCLHPRLCHHARCHACEDVERLGAGRQAALTHESQRLELAEQRRRAAQLPQQSAYGSVLTRLAYDGDRRVDRVFDRGHSGWRAVVVAAALAGRAEVCPDVSGEAGGDERRRLPAFAIPLLARRRPAPILEVQQQRGNAQQGGYISKRNSKTS